MITEVSVYVSYSYSCLSYSINPKTALGSEVWKILSFQSITWKQTLHTDNGSGVGQKRNTA